MKNLFKKYLREENKNGMVTFSWYKLSALDILGVFIAPMLIMYAIGERLQWEEIWGLKIIPMNLTARVILYAAIILLISYLLFNRKSILVIDSEQISLRKRTITGKRWNFSKDEIVELRTKLQKDYHENDVGHYPEIYTFSILLKNNRTIRLGSFNAEDSKRLKEKLNR